MRCLFDHSFRDEYYHSAVLCIQQGKEGSRRKEDKGFM